MQHGTYPTTQQGLSVLTKNDEYFKDGKMPKDSWGDNFIYMNNNGKVELVSLGANGKEGGKGIDADIKMSQCK